MFRTQTHPHAPNAGTRFTATRRPRIRHTGTGSPQAQRPQRHGQTGTNAAAIRLTSIRHRQVSDTELELTLEAEPMLLFVSFVQKNNVPARAMAPAGRPIRRFSARIYASTYALSSIRCSFRSVSVTLSIDPTLTLADRLFLWHVEVFLLKAGVETAVSGASVSCR